MGFSLQTQRSNILVLQVMMFTGVIPEDFRRNMPVIVEYKKTQDVVCVLHNPETNVLRAALSSGYF